MLLCQNPAEDCSSLQERILVHGLDWLQNGTQELLLPKELYCVMGCNDAVNLYFQRLKGKHTIRHPRSTTGYLLRCDIAVGWLFLLSSSSCNLSARLAERDDADAVP